MEYYNEDGENITRFINSGRTKIFDPTKEAEAKKYAKVRKSYVYSVYVKTEKTPKYHFGYAVPK